MNTDKAKGKAKEVKGQVKQKVGRTTGHSRTEAEGVADETEGKVQKNYGKAKDKLD